MVALLLLLIVLLLLFGAFGKMVNEGAETTGAVIGAIVIGGWFLLKFICTKILLPAADLINSAFDKCYDAIVYRKR